MNGLYALLTDSEREKAKQLAVSLRRAAALYPTDNNPEDVRNLLELANKFERMSEKPCSKLSP